MARSTSGTSRPARAASSCARRISKL
jgi:hypothetical protein